jgi:glycerol uptake facilitator-like aquaporin
MLECGGMCRRSEFSGRSLRWGVPNWRLAGAQACKGRASMRLVKDNSLTIILLLLFAGSILGQWLTGWHVAIEDATRHGGAGISLGSYTLSPEFLSSVFENWESEFLQMSAYVVLTAMLVQRGSSESKDPDSPPRDSDLAVQAMKPGAPGVLRKGRLARALYSRSLGLALFVLFLLSFVMHWTQSAHAAAAEAREHGEAALSTIAYLGDPQLWFESFQNWQSEFLSTAVLVLLSIVLRQRESPESKPVAAPHSQTGE